MRNNFKQHASSSVLISAFAIGAAAFAANGYAAQSSGAFAVTASVTAACTVSGSPLAFGDFSALGGDVDGTSTLTATCTNGSPYTIGLSAGVSAGAAVTTRHLTHTDAITLLNYNLSPVASGGINWDLIGGTTTKAGTGDGAAQEITVFGRIPGGQTSAIVGTYSDTITATIDF
jgi:spore coat protein U-like protein